MRINTFARVLLVVASALTIGTASVIVPAFADPFPFAGSSGPPGTGEATGVTVHTANVTLAGLPAGTTWTGRYLFGQCIKSPTATSFIWDSGSYGPFSECAYKTSDATYEFRVRTPSGQVGARWVEFEQGSSPNIYYVDVDAVCRQGSTPCSGGSDGAVRTGGAGLSPSVTLGPLPTAPSGYVYCTAEGESCQTPAAGRQVRFGPVGEPANYATARAGNDGKIACSASSFGGADPAPNRLKDCYYAAG